MSAHLLSLFGLAVRSVMSAPVIRLAARRTSVLTSGTKLRCHRVLLGCRQRTDRHPAGATQTVVQVRPPSHVANFSRNLPGSTPQRPIPRNLLRDSPLPGHPTAGPADNSAPEEDSKPSSINPKRPKRPWRVLAADQSMSKLREDCVDGR